MEMSEINEKVTNKKNERANLGEEQSPEVRKNNEQNSYAGLQTKELIGLLVERDQKIEELERELESAKDSHLRKAAELENMKKRVQRERSQLYDMARDNALKDFLPVNDDLQRTLKAFEETDVNENFMDGVSLVANKFEEVLKKYGVERIDQELVPFNVDLHDAMMSQKPEDEAIGSNMVLKVLENGYRMGERTIRHAKVIVSE